MWFPVNKVINGKLYNTETAQMLIEAEVAHDNYGIPIASARLYRKRTGEYFLCTYDDISETLGIKPLPSLSEAKAWAEKHLDGNEYQEIFGEIEEDSETEEELNQQISILLPVSLHNALKAKKQATGKNVSALIIKALRDAGY